MSRAEVVQSMRTGAFGEFVVLGSQYRGEEGVSWHIALLPPGDPIPRIHHVVAGELPDELTVDERDALIEAIKLWESQPLSRPN